MIKGELLKILEDFTDEIEIGIERNDEIGITAITGERFDYIDGTPMIVLESNLICGG